MVILDTVGVVVVISDERRPLKYTGAGAAAETVGVETLAHRLQHTVCNLLSTSGTHRQGILRRNRKNIRCKKRHRRTFKCKRMWPSLLTKNTQNKTVNLLKQLKVKSVYDFVSPHHIAVLTLRWAVPVIELHALQGAVAAHATEAVGVEEFIHGSHSRLGTGESLATLATNLYKEEGEGGFTKVTFLNHHFVWYLQYNLN